MDFEDKIKEEQEKIEDVKKINDELKEEMEKLTNNKYYKIAKINNRELEKLSDDLEDLYDEIKEHFDAVKDSKARGSLHFVEKQTTNLIAIKKSRAEILGEINKSYKDAFDLDLKDRRMEMNEEKQGDSSLNEDVVRLIKDLSSGNQKNTTRLPDNNENESKIEAELDMRKKDINILDSIYKDEQSFNKDDLFIEDDEVNEIEEEKSNDESSVKHDEILVCDENENFYIINDDYEILKDLGELYKIETFVELDGIKYAQTEDDNFYELIETE